jgi:Fic family protein
MMQDNHTALELVEPEFDSEFMKALIDLDHLRKLSLQGSTTPWLFFQLKQIFHLLESVGSARIEGNRTTISEYVEQKIHASEQRQERFSEIANVEAAMDFIEKNIQTGSKITNSIIRELHKLTVVELSSSKEGDRTPGEYRSWSVEIAKSNHSPMDAMHVNLYMEELLTFINHDHPPQYDLIKIAIAHHRFAWIHPFGNGNGRTVRLLTYALLIKYGFNVQEGQLLNPTAVFCNDRQKYYEMLAVADKGDVESISMWCEYVLVGIRDEITKVNKLLNHDYLYASILLPAILHSLERELITKDESIVLRMGAKKQSFKSSDIERVLPKLSPRQRTHMIAKLKEKDMIQSFSDSTRKYYVSFSNNYLLRGLIRELEQEGFIPSTDS